jgi:ammonium transporter, Amt family
VGGSTNSLQWHQPGHWRQFSCVYSLLPYSSTFSLAKSILDADKENLNQWYQSGDTAYIIVASAMVFVMVPGLGFLYSGLARRKSALSMLWACMGSYSVITFQWYFWGYSLAFSNYATNGFIGDLKKFGLMNTLAAPSPGSPLIPDLLYAFYQV